MSIEDKNTKNEIEMDFKKDVFNIFSKQFEGVSFDEESGFITIPRNPRKKPQKDEMSNE